jgi:N-acetyl-gamma-glutamylphosphate reductase
MKHTGSVLVVLLVGLLIACTSTVATATHGGCTTMEQYLDLVRPQNPGAHFIALTPKDLVIFRYNYNQTPPVSGVNITSVVIGTMTNRSEILVVIAIDGCIKFQSGVSIEFLEKMLKEPHEALFPIPSRYKLTNMPTSKFNVIG